MSFTPFNLGDALYSFILHFMFSFVAGAATWVTLSYVLRAFDSVYSYRNQPLDIVSGFILSHRQLFLLTLSLAVALIAHILEDYYFNFF